MAVARLFLFCDLAIFLPDKKSGFAYISVF
jgi:hypothetical protein